MHEIEYQGPIPGSIQETFYRQMVEIDNTIEEKYQFKRPTDEARQDALVFAASQLGYSMVEPFIANLEEEDAKICDATAIQWDYAISLARYDDWSEMKNAIQEYARLTLTIASTELRDKNPLISEFGEREQRIADAFINLIQSIDA